jgi:hypothetical protein
MLPIFVVYTEDGGNGQVDYHDIVVKVKIGVAFAFICFFRVVFQK